MKFISKLNENICSYIAVILILTLIALAIAVEGIMQLIVSFIITILSIILGFLLNYFKEIKDKEQVYLKNAHTVLTLLSCQISELETSRRHFAKYKSDKERSAKIGVFKSDREVFDIKREEIISLNENNMSKIVYDLFGEQKFLNEYYATINEYNIHYEVEMKGISGCILRQVKEGNELLDNIEQKYKKINLKKIFNTLRNNLITTFPNENFPTL